MKIAMVAPYAIYPPDEGGRVRAYALLTNLADAGHETVLFTSRAPANERIDARVRVYETTPAGRRRQIISSEFLRRALPIARRERPDVIVSEYPWPGLHAAYLARRVGVPLVLDAPNVEGERFRSVGARYWRAVDAYERLVARLADAVFVVSEEDRARFLARRVAGRKLQVVPNGVDPSALHPDGAARARVRRELGIDEPTRVLLFFGQLDYTPNRQALDALVREVLPRLDRCGVPYATVVAGKGAPPPEPHPGMRFAGRVERISDYINAADAVLVPVTSGGGTRLKVLESVACGTPVVSTATGAEGVDRAACGDLLRIADGWDAFAEAIAAVPVRRDATVPERFLELYAWANIVRRIAWPRRA